MIQPIFVLIFVTTLVNTEWVEITQRHDRKPDYKNHDSKYTTNINSENNSELNKVYKNKQQSDLNVRKPVKGNRIYIKHDDDGDRLKMSYPRDDFLKENDDFKINPGITRSDNFEKKYVKENDKSHTEVIQKVNKEFIARKNSDKQDPRKPLENTDDIEVRKNNLKKLQSQEDIQTTVQSAYHRTKDLNDNEVKSTTERIRVITSKKGNRVYFLYNDNRPSLVKNKIVKAKNGSDNNNVPTQAASRNNQLEEKHKTTTNSPKKSTSYNFTENQYQEQRTQSTDSQTQGTSSITQIIETTQPYKKNTEENDNIKGKIAETITKIESKTNIPESEVAKSNENNHKFNTHTRNYFTTEAVKVLTSKKGNKIYFIYKDLNIDEPTLENYENITEVTSPSTAIDASLELQSSEISGKINKDVLQSNTMPTSETVNDDTAKIPDKNNTNEMKINEKTDNTSILNANKNETNKHNLPERTESKINIDDSKNKWIKGHVYRVPNFAHVSKLNKTDPELLNITHINHDKPDSREDTNKEGNVEDNVFMIEHPTAIVDKAKLESYDELPTRRKVDLSDGENTPEFVTIQDQDFDDRFEEIYIVDGDDTISELLEEEMKKNDDEKFRLESDEEDIDGNKSDNPTAETKNEREVNHKRNPIENIIKFMRVVADNIAKNTHTSYESKIRYLKELKESIMRSIEERIDAAWPDDVLRSRRDARGHHIEFPSSESALMTISFLTFAVYLIKLVLHVIQAYKNKTTMFPAVVAVSRAAELANILLNND